jgi:MFS family permease
MGFLLIIGGTICFLYGLETGSSGLRPWHSATVILLIVFGALIMVLFMVWEAKFAKKPLIPVRIFQKSTSLASFTVACLHSFVFISFDFFLPLYYQVVLGFRPLISGVTLFALIIPMSISTFCGGFFVRKTGNYLAMIFLGTSLFTLGTGLFIGFGTSISWPRIIVFEVVAGVGAGLLFQSPMIALQSHLRQSDISAAMSAFTFLRNLSTSISIVIGTVVIQQTIGSGSLTTVIDNGSSGASSRKQYVLGLRNMWIFYTCTASVTIFATFFIKSKKRKTKGSQEQDSEQALEQVSDS